MLVRICRGRIHRLYLWGSEGRVNTGLVWEMKWSKERTPRRRSSDSGWRAPGALSKGGLLGKKVCCGQSGNGEQPAGGGAYSSETVEPPGSAVKRREATRASSAGGWLKLGGSFYSKS